MKTIAEQLKDTDDLLHSQFFLSESEGKDLMILTTTLSAQPVDLNLSNDVIGNDVITFS